MSSESKPVQIDRVHENVQLITEDAIPSSTKVDCAQKLDLSPEKLSPANQDDPSIIGPATHRVDSGWTAWLTVLASFLQMFVSLGTTYAFGIVSL